MTDYTELVKALRICVRWHRADDALANAEQAAAAIEALQTEVKKLNGLIDAQLVNSEPKQGEWITHPEVKNIYGGVYIECPFCGEKYVVQNVSDEKFCRNCGADLRAKMEVQE